MTSTAIAVNPALFKNLPYDPLRILRRFRNS